MVELEKSTEVQVPGAHVEAIIGRSTYYRDDRDIANECMIMYGVDYSIWLQPGCSRQSLFRRLFVRHLEMFGRLRLTRLRHITNYPRFFDFVSSFRLHPSESALDIGPEQVRGDYFDPEPHI